MELVAVFVNWVGGNSGLIGPAIGILGLGFAAIRYRKERQADHSRRKLNGQVEDYKNILATKDRELTRERNNVANLRNKLSQSIEHVRGWARDIELREEKVNRLTSALEDARGEIWQTFDARQSPEHYAALTSRKPVIISVANLKGGVGKTTLAANLAAYFSKRQKKRVLLIDLDYQGSLTTTYLIAIGKSEMPVKTASDLFAAGADGSRVLEAAIDLSALMPGSSLVPCSAGFAPFENSLMVDWLLGDSGDDLRYRLANVLLREEVTNLYDVVIIDTPPRLTTGTVNALCASSHFLVPTILDFLSAKQVISLLSMIKQNIRPLNPALELLGVVAVLTQLAPRLVARETQVTSFLEEHMPTYWNQSARIFERHIPRKAAMAEVAGQNIPYFTDDTVKKWFDELGSELIGPLAPANRNNVNKLLNFDGAMTGMFMSDKDKRALADSSRAGPDNGEGAGKDDGPGLKLVTSREPDLLREETSGTVVDS